MVQRVRTTPRKKPRQARSQATVDAIVQATAHVLVEDGYEGTSTNRVAARAGVSVGSLYQYFPNKEALVGELLDRYSRDVTETVIDRLRALADAPPAVVVRAMVEWMVALKRREPRLAKVLREQIPRVGRLQRHERQLAQVVAAAEEYLARWRHLLRPDDVSTAAFVAVHTVDHLTHAALTQERSLPDRVLIDQVTDLVCIYLLRPSAISSPS